MNDPIILIGCPRSGTTITLYIMALHKQVAWVSNYLHKQPQNENVTFWNRVYDIPFWGKRFYTQSTQKKTKLGKVFKHYLPYPVEPWNFWNHYLENFQWERGGDITPRRRTPDDISKEEIIKIQRAVHTVMKKQGKKRFLSKYTDFPRMKYLMKAFPNARFIHIVRDGRAVAASYQTKIEKNKWNTWNEKEWWASGWPDQWQTNWRENGSMMLGFVAYQWKFFVSEILKDAKSIPSGQYIEIKYKDIIDSPLDTFNEIFDFSSLSPCPKVDWYLRNINLGDMNKKWMNKYTRDEKEVLNSIISEPQLKQFLDNK